MDSAVHHYSMISDALCPLRRRARTPAVFCTEQFDALQWAPMSTVLSDIWIVQERRSGPQHQAPGRPSQMYFTAGAAHTRVRAFLSSLVTGNPFLSHGVKLYGAKLSREGGNFRGTE